MQNLNLPPAKRGSCPAPPGCLKPGLRPYRGLRSGGFSWAPGAATRAHSASSPCCLPVALQDSQLSPNQKRMSPDLTSLTGSVTLSKIT